MDIESMTKELEATIASAPEAKNTDLAGDIRKSVLDAVKGVIAKAGGKDKDPTSDLSAEQGAKDAGAEDVEKDPAEKPKPTCKGYKDSSKYVSKGAACDDDEDADDEPPMMSKKKSVKKSAEANEEVDATDFMCELAKSVDYLAKSVAELKEGAAVQLEMLSDLADPRREKLDLTVAKAVAHLVEENKSLKKSLQDSSDLMKSVSRLPGAPKAIGMQVIETEVQKSAKAELTKGDRDALFKAASKHEISMDQYRQALQTGDLSCISKK